MAFNLTYDPSTDPEAMQAQEASDAEAYAIGEQMEQDQAALLAGKYRNAEELEQAYIELQRKLGSKDQDEPSDDQTDDEQPEEEEEPSEDPYVDFLFTASDEYAQTGTLSEETMAAFSEMSSTELVDAYIRFQQQLPQDQQSESVELSDNQISQIHNSVGGEGAYQQLTQWAAQNFAPEEIAAYDSVIESGNMAAISLALQALYYRFTDEAGFEGTMIQGKAAQPADVFRSQAEVVRAMSDPRYDNDPAYRQDVFNKLERSDLTY